jgi:phosphatidylglycerophosphate synthase
VPASELTPAQRWSALHHGIDPARVPLLMPWLRLMWLLARGLRRVPPLVLTGLGVVLAAGAVPLAGPLPWAAVIAVLGAAVCDGLDGAVAVVTDHATRAGASADAIADRISDVAFALVVWRCGVPGWLAAVCAALAVGVDVLRRVRRRPDRITVAERPTFTICAALAAGSAAVTAAMWPPTVCAGVWAVAGVIGTAQVALR